MAVPAFARKPEFRRRPRRMTSPDFSIDAPRPDVGLIRPITDDEREVFKRDGAAVVRGIIPLEWIDYIRAGVIRLMERSDSSSQTYSPASEPRFFGQSFPWLLDDVFKDWALHGPLVDLACQVMPQARSLNFFYDQIFAKEPHATATAPYHQDAPYLPLKGSQILRIWTPLDPVTQDSGAVHYLKGSHRWGIIYHPRGYKTVSEYQPDFERDYDDYDWLVGESTPGDVLLHDPRVVHGSGGNHTSLFRRALTTIYTGDRVTWNPGPASMFNNKEQTGHIRVPRLTPGGPVDSELFPRVWPTS
ncbi:phytanoyl-CoA dioxygenase family protein (plasmid) [Nocardia sp. CWNU-33]|uniref:phytanoyl-CoA dioxygenase family protein n=1 Tax=Nocardia sp. CWNU-33 TaxID=3392117 RepID=UPI00398F5F71